MVVRIHNADKWEALPIGSMLELPGEHRRKIRVELNCPAPTRVDLVQGDKLTFLAVVEGHEVLEFSAGENPMLACTSESEVWYFTNDGDLIAMERPEAVSFTKIASRRARNPELERMMWKMEQNMERRLAAQRVEMEALRQQLEAERVDPDTGEVHDEPEADDGAGATGDAAGDEPGEEVVPPPAKAKGAKSGGN